VFETGYPYIGFSSRFYDQIAELLKQRVGEEMECTKGQHWGICRVANRTCDTLSLNYNLTFTINDVEFTIPLENMVAYVNQTRDTMYCQMQIAALPNSENDVILGGAFFTAFVGIFDVENDRIGFAQSTRALPGSSMCPWPGCDAVTEVKPEEKTEHHTKASTRNALIALIILLVIIALLLTVYCLACRKRALRPDQTFQMDTDHDDQEEALNVDYEKPTVN